MNKFKLTDELKNNLIVIAKQRAINFQLSKQKEITMQHEFILGACAALDFLNQSKETSITPAAYFSIIRGELIH